jgi:hypothetical protein
VPHRRALTTPLPRKDDGSEHLIGEAHQGKGGRLDAAAFSVQAVDPELRVRRLAFGDGDHQRELLGSERTAGDVGGMPQRRPLTLRHLAGLVEAHAEHAFRGLVVEDERRVGVHEEDRHRERARELTHEDQLDRFLRHGPRHYLRGNSKSRACSTFAHGTPRELRGCPG